MTELINNMNQIERQCYTLILLKVNKLMEYNSELEVALQDFKQLLKENSIPPKMIIKLRYLESVILDLKKEQDLITELPEFERLSLLQMSRENQITLFISIVKCYSGKEIIQYFSNQKSTIRKDQTFSGWTTCYLSCNSDRIIANKKSENKDVWHEFYLEKLFISKVYRQQKKRYIFGIAYEKHKYQIGFEEEGTCARIHGIIINLIRERRGLREKLKEIRSSEVNQSDGASELQFEKEVGTFDNGFDEEQYIEFEQKEYLSHLQEKVLGYELFDNSSFELVKNIEKGRMLENRQASSFKICILLEKLNIESILEKFIEFTQWNSQIETFKIINRIRSNTFLAYLKLKKYSMLTYPRETYLTITYIKTCACLGEKQGESQLPKVELGKHYLLMNSQEHEENTATLGSVKMNLEQIAEFSVLEDSPQTIFMVLWSKIDFKGYDYFNYNRQMNIQYLNDFAYFSSYCKQSREQYKIYTFEPNYCFCRFKRSRKNSCQSDISILSNKEEDEPKPVAQIVQKKKIDVASVVQNCHRGFFDDVIVQIIKKLHFEKYCLKHRFSEAVRNSEYKQSNYTYKQEKDFLLQNGRWKIVNNTLIFGDEEILKAQKGVLKMVLKQIGSNLMSGKSIMNMSLPVQIFDNKSMLQVLANMMGFFPRFINDAINTSNLVEQMKFVTMSYIFVNSCYPNVQKPFNPILGETFQGLLGGIPIYFEQTFHHPPISSLFMKTADFETSGNFDMHVDMGLNSAYSKMSSYFNVKISSSKTEYIIRLPDVELSGISFGDRTLRLASRGFVYEKTNNIYCEISIGKDKKKVYEYNSKLKNSDLAGGIFKVTPAFGKRLYAMDRNKPFQGVKFDEIIEKYCHISGKWYGDIFFDNIPYKTVENGPFPVRVERLNYLLPSDSLFRTDVIYKNKNHLQKSNEQKQILQNLQRKDKKLRQKSKQQ